MRRHTTFIGVLLALGLVGGLVYVALGQTLPSWTPTRIELTYVIEDTNGTPDGYRMGGTVEFYSQADRLGQVIIHDLRPYLTTQEKAQLMAMMARLRNVAQNYYRVPG